MPKKHPSTKKLAKLGSKKSMVSTKFDRYNQVIDDAIVKTLSRTVLFSLMR